MHLKYYDATFKSVLSSDVCNKIIEYGLSQTFKEASVDGGHVNDIRNSEIAWLYDAWIYDLIQPYIEKANKVSEWNFQYYPTQEIQFAKYGIGQYYDWHRDSFTPLQKDGKIRKLSITVNLSDDYEGGGFYIDSEERYNQTNPIEVVDLKHKGSICVFPSDVFHKIDKVTKGIRYSLVIWLSGEAWR